MSKTYKYMNTTDHELVVIGLGVVQAGEVITSPEPVENPNLELVTTASSKALNRERSDV